MLPYIILIGVPICICSGSLFVYKAETKEKIVRIGITCFFVILVLILTFRGLLIGNDTALYKLFYDSTKHMNWTEIFNSEFEVGYVFLEKLISSQFESFTWFLLIVSVLSLAPVYKFYLEESKKPVLTILLFVTVAPFSMYFSGLRQILAMGLAIPAFKMAKEKSILKFCIVVLLAYCFHRSAFIIGLLYPLCNLKITKRRVWIAAPIIIFIYIFKERIFMYLVTLISDIYTSDISHTGAYSILILLILFGIFAYIIPDENKLSRDALLMRNILLLAICIQCFASINQLAMRMNYYFLLFVPIIVPEVINASKIRYRQIAKLATVVMCVFFTVYFFYNTADGGGLNIYPYVPIWR